MNNCVIRIMWRITATERLDFMRKKRREAMSRELLYYG